MTFDEAIVYLGNLSPCHVRFQKDSAAPRLDAWVDDLDLEFTITRGADLYRTEIRYESDTEVRVALAQHTTLFAAASHIGAALAPVPSEGLF